MGVIQRVSAFSIKKKLIISYIPIILPRSLVKPQFWRPQKTILYHPKNLEAS